MLTRPIEEDASAHDPDVDRTMRTKRAHTMQVDQQPRAVRGAKNIRRRTCDIDRGSEVTREGGTTKSPYWRCSGNLPPQTQVYFGGKFGHGHWHNTSRVSLHYHIHISHPNYVEHPWPGHLYYRPASSTLPPRTTFAMQSVVMDRCYLAPRNASMPQPPKSGHQ